MTPLARSIVILDFGGQYAHLIASRIRRFGYSSYIFPADTSVEVLKDAAGIILSGGPQSVYEAGSPQADKKIFDLKIPILGLCYGHHWIAHALGGRVGAGKTKEYGPVRLTIHDAKSPLFIGLPKEFTVWMSHGDEVQELPQGFSCVASTVACRNAVMADTSRKIFGVQYHGEVTHSEYGFDVLRKFVELCSPAKWSMDGYAAWVGAQVQKEVGDRRVFMLVSGGVDSTVAFTLLNKVLGHERVFGLLIDTGLMRKNEVVLITKALKALDIKNLQVVDASERFLAALRGLTEPEAKRQAIGKTFLDVQRDISKTLEGDDWMLGQGTIYPDTIETGGTKHADKIKTHHNRIPEIQKMIEEGRVIEPLKDLYKDEVRALGEELGLPHALVWRHPFPGPGLGVRILCGDTEESIDSITLPKIDVACCVLHVKSVGVQGDGRTYRHALALFHPDAFSVPQICRILASSIPNSNPSFSRVVLCLSHSVPQEFIFTPRCITRRDSDLLREADAIVMEAIERHGLMKEIWQFPVVSLPIGCKKNSQSIVLRPVASSDAMTADTYIPTKEFLSEVTKKILLLPGIDAVFLDLTSKPPGTIEWE